MSPTGYGIMTDLLLVAGVSCSGKSTWIQSRELSGPRVGRGSLNERIQAGPLLEPVGAVHWPLDKPVEPFEAAWAYVASRKVSVVIVAPSPATIRTRVAARRGSASDLRKKSHIMRRTQRYTEVNFLYIRYSDFLRSAAKLDLADISILSDVMNKNVSSETAKELIREQYFGQQMPQNLSDRFPSRLNRTR